MASVSGSIDPAILQRLGLIVTRWSGVEEYQGRFVAFLVGGHQGLMPLITSDASAAALTGWLRTLAELRFKDPHTISTLGELFDRIDEARAERNALVHALWSSEGIDGCAIAQTIKLKRPEMISSQFVTIDDLDELAGEILFLIKELAYLAVELGFKR